MTNFEGIGDEMFKAYKNILDREERKILKGIDPIHLASLNKLKQDASTVAGDESLSADEKKAKIMDLYGKMNK